MSFESVAYGFNYRRCANCGETAYAHRDHTHIWSVEGRRICPFGDCDTFTERAL